MQAVVKVLHMALQHVFHRFFFLTPYSDTFTSVSAMS